MPSGWVACSFVRCHKGRGKRGGEREKVNDTSFNTSPFISNYYTVKSRVPLAIRRLKEKKEERREEGKGNKTLS